MCGKGRRFVSDLLQIFWQYRGKKIAVYGLGAETRRVLDELEKEVTIVGLLDSYRTEGSFYGKSILPLETVIAEGVELILVAARPGSGKAIAKRIGKKCMENQIALWDIRGKDLCDTGKPSYGFAHVEGYTKSDLLQTAEAFDVISVDLFDTLVMRRTLFPGDVFELVDYRLREKGIVIEAFCEKRMESEKALSADAAPTLVQIYERVLANSKECTLTPQELAGIEWSADQRLLIPREEVCDVISGLYHRGKEICIVTDTYYSDKQIKIILDRCGIEYTRCFVSCTLGTGKRQGLFGVLKEAVKGKRCLHIGDDAMVDVAEAKRNGIVPFQLYSGIDLFEMTGYLGLWEETENLSDRIRVGMLTARLFNSPFQFEEDRKNISVSHARDIGYLFFAPMISDFVVWFDRQVQIEKIQNIWFGARDGYLIKKLYEKWNPDVPVTYFLTSRIAAIRAGVENEEDIRSVGEMKFSGSLKKQMQERFGISVACEDDSQILVDYMDLILERAAICRKNYKNYVEKLAANGTIAFFDFVAKGTTQMYIGRLTDHPLKGLYFLQLEEEYMQGKGLDIVPFYNRIEKDSSVIFDSYYILETVLTAPEAMVLEFDSDGKPAYGNETRSESDIACLMDVQNGIESYFQTYMDICPRETITINKKIDEIILSLLGGITILDTRFLQMKVEDPFFNRMTDVTDLM